MSDKEQDTSFIDLVTKYCRKVELTEEQKKDKEVALGIINESVLGYKIKESFRDQFPEGKEIVIVDFELEHYNEESPNDSTVKIFVDALT